MKIVVSRFAVIRFGMLLAISGPVIVAAGCQRKAPQPVAPAPATQMTFATPDEAVTELRTAAGQQDPARLFRLFGPDSSDLVLSGDPVDDQNRRADFAKHLAEGTSFIPLSDEAEKSDVDDAVAILVGPSSWPFPIPLIKQHDRWRFDTAAGKEEILNRRIGYNELHALATCKGIVEAEAEYRAKPHDHEKSPAYAAKFISSPGRHDGLYWISKANKPESPLGPLVALAATEGYRAREGHEPKPYEGYFYRILTKQGSHAPGGAEDYLKEGRLADGYAVVAYPAKWGASGEMTFLVGKDGVIYQKDLGAQTEELASGMTEYDPDDSWTAAATAK